MQHGIESVGGEEESLRPLKAVCVAITPINCLPSHPSLHLCVLTTSAPAQGFQAPTSILDPFQSADAQPSSYRLNLGSVSGDAGGYVELVNPNDFAIDLSDAKLSGAAEFTFAKGEEMVSLGSLKPGTRSKHRHPSLWPPRFPPPRLSPHGRSPPFKPTGTTVAAGDSVHVAADVGAFVKAKGGAGLYVVGPFSGSIQGPAASVSVQSAGGDSLVG